MILPTLVLISFILSVTKIFGSIALSWFVVLSPGLFSIWIYLTVFIALKLAHNICKGE